MLHHLVIGTWVSSDLASMDIWDPISHGYHRTAGYINCLITDKIREARESLELRAEATLESQQMLA